MSSSASSSLSASAKTESGRTDFSPTRALAALASLKLTVTLFAMMMVLIFAGTLAQAQDGVWTVVANYFRAPVAWIDLQIFFPRQLLAVPASVPFPGGLTLGGLAAVNLLAAHLVRFRLTRKRVGVVTLHLGLFVLLAGEFVTAFWAEEGMMAIDEGSSSNYVEDNREVELAIIDHSNPQWDSQVTIPQSILTEAARQQRAIEHPDLPVTVRVERWLANSRLRRSQSAAVAGRGAAAELEAVEVARVSGAEGGQVDVPSAYVSLSRGGEPLGRWLVSAHLARPQPLDLAGGDYGIDLRFKRTYKPYRLHLIDFRHDKFVGTEVPRNFSSRVRLLDPARGTDREVLIYMNHPLRHAGETFYQASYKPDNTGTVLQVVRNPGWLLPYIACVIITGGMLLHFGMNLTGFLRRSRERPHPAAAPAKEPMSPIQRGLPWAMAALGLVIALSGLMRPAGTESPYDVAGFAALPVSAGGRVKPMDTVARNAVMIASGKQTVKTEAGDLSASQFLLRLIARPDEVRTLPVVRVDHPDLLTLIGQEPTDVGRYSLDDIQPHWRSIIQQAAMAQEVPQRRRDPYQQAVLGLHDKTHRLLALAQMRSPYSIPPLGPDENWRPFHEALLDSGVVRAASAEQSTDGPDAVHPGVAWYTAMMTHYQAENPERFNAAVADYHRLLDQTLPAEMNKAELEVLFNRIAPFYGATIVYVLAFLLLCGFMLLQLRQRTERADASARGSGLRRAAVGLLWAALIVHTAGMFVRIYLQGRPPVTNLYSSAVFVGWAAVLVGLWLERYFPLGLAAMGSAVVGGATLIVAHNLGSDGDTMQMMQAVLDSNFWLATHVITISLGYSATFLAGILATIYLLLGVFTRGLTAERAGTLSRMVYGVVCFALLLSFVGTVLGGIWADQSWGRFWGWDPKENGAALVVLINALILHARWGGMIRQRGLMVLAVAGNIVTAWSWFGTNMLGVGLHSYGFMESAVFALMMFVISQLALMALGLLPMPMWRSPGRG
ncbi:MAG: cytochrome c biogenesis protein CcsA [Phycisphaeraceae bacterium]